MYRCLFSPLTMYEDLPMSLGLRMFIITRFIFCQYHAIILHPIKHIIRFMCVVICVLIIIYYCKAYDIKLLVTNYLLIRASEYLINVIFSAVTGEKYFLKYISGMVISDAVMGYKIIVFFPIYLRLQLFLMAFLRIHLYIIYDILTHRKYLFSASFFMFSAIDFNYFTTATLFSLLNTRIRSLRLFLEKGTSIFQAIGENEFRSSRIVRKALWNYKYLMDAIAAIDTELQFKIILSLIIQSVVFMAYFYSWLKEGIDLGFSTPLVLTSVTKILLNIIGMTSPCLLVASIANEVYKIRILLCKHIAWCSDASLLFELEKAELYLRSQPFVFKILATVTINAGLPLQLLSLCLSYIMIAIQYNHFS